MKNQHLISLFIFLLIALGCQPSQTVLNDRQPTLESSAEPTPEVPVDDFAERLKSVQTADFNYVFVFRRKDGQAFDVEDRQIFRMNTDNMNQRQMTSDQKALIVGSNYTFPPEKFETLKKRFAVEDYSPDRENGQKNVKTDTQQDTKVNR